MKFNTAPGLPAYEGSKAQVRAIKADEQVRDRERRSAENRRIYLIEKIARLKDELQEIEKRLREDNKAA